MPEPTPPATDPNPSKKADGADAEGRPASRGAPEGGSGWQVRATPLEVSDEPAPAQGPTPVGNEAPPRAPLPPDAGAPIARTAPPDIHVHIDQIEVRARDVTPTSPPPTSRPGPNLTIEEYARERREGRR